MAGYLWHTYKKKLCPRNTVVAIFTKKCQCAKVAGHRATVMIGGREDEDSVSALNEEPDGKRSAWCPPCSCRLTATLTCVSCAFAPPAFHSLDAIHALRALQTTGGAQGESVRWWRCGAWLQNSCRRMTLSSHGHAGRGTDSQKVLSSSDLI
jgi:hypothetical protein